jgi:hypothetical protein
LEPRYIVNPRSKKKKLLARRHFFYIPFQAWQQDLFKKKELIPHMANDLPTASYPPGHVRRSLGWFRKVIQNVNISSDRRNKAFSFSCDGVPYFNDMGCMSGWPGLLHDETLPAGVAKTEEHAHMVFLVPSFFFKVNRAGLLVKIKR